MLISCKCLNFIATSNNNSSQQKQQSQQQQQQLPAATTAAVATADLKENNATVAAVAMQQSSNDCNNSLVATSAITTTTTSSNNNSIVKPSNDDESFSLTNALRQTFLQKYPRNFVFYSQCVDFFKQAIGPVNDLTINVLSQKDLIYSVTLEISEAQNSSSTRSSWQISICSNCNVALCAKRLSNNTAPQFLINCGLLTNNEELSQKRSDKSFSDTFGILIIDHPKLESSIQNQNTTSNSTIGSLSTSFATSSVTSHHLDSKQLRLRQLQTNLQQRLQREIAETDERIQRYTAQQFALLKSFREKSEQEYQMLVTLIQCIPEQQANEWLERQPPSLDVCSNSGNLSYGAARRRNTISSRRELNNTTAPNTPTTTQPPNNIFNINRDNSMKNSLTATPTSPTSAIMTTTTTIPTGVADNNTQSPAGGASTATTPTIVGSNSSALNRKMSNFDTPPATPEAIPMSVGNSPTFRQQQQQQQHTTFASHPQTFQQFSSGSIETADDCLFELEGVDSSNITSPQQLQNRTMYLQNPPSPLRLLQTHQQQQQQQQSQQQQHLQPQNVPHQILPPFNSYQRSLSYINAQPENHMSDLDESDDAEEAEDALDLDSSMPIAMTATPSRRIHGKGPAAQGVNFAKSLPIEIANSPLAAVGRSYMATLESDEDELDNNVDIAASIKALAKSVHGEAVFGDLPRPRLRSQI
ncbi:proline-rich Akt substrate 40 kDa [Cochliomyia hominivorax]